MTTQKPTTDHLYRRFYEGQPERLAELKEARAEDAIVRLAGGSNTFEIILSAQVQKSWRVNGTKTSDNEFIALIFNYLRD